MFENKLWSVRNSKRHTNHKVLNILNALNSKIKVWLLNDDLTQQEGYSYVWKSDEIFNFSKIFKF